MKALIATGFLLLIACSSVSPRRDDSSYGASVGIVNHTDKYIHSASVNGAGGANMGAWGAGAANVCYVSVANNWKPGTKAHVRWDVPDGSKHTYKEKTVEVEMYDNGGSVYLHFFPNDVVRVVISRYAGWSLKHPIPSPKAPAEQTSLSR